MELCSKAPGHKGNISTLRNWEETFIYDLDRDLDLDQMRESDAEMIIYFEISGKNSLLALLHSKSVTFIMKI